MCDYGDLSSKVHELGVDWENYIYCIIIPCFNKSWLDHEHEQSTLLNEATPVTTAPLLNHFTHYFYIANSFCRDYEDKVKIFAEQVFYFFFTELKCGNINQGKETCNS